MTGWEERLLEDLQDGPVLYCPDGFMGRILEGLVARGLVVREDAGFMPPLKDLEGRPILQLKATKFQSAYRYNPTEHPQCRYSLKEPDA